MNFKPIYFQLNIIGYIQEFSQICLNWGQYLYSVRCTFVRQLHFVHWPFVKQYPIFKYLLNIFFEKIIIYISGFCQAVQYVTSKIASLYVVDKPFISFPKYTSTLHCKFFFVLKTNDVQTLIMPCITCCLTSVFLKCVVLQFVAHFFRSGFLFHMMTLYSSEYFQCCWTTYSQNQFLGFFGIFFKMGLTFV